MPREMTAEQARAFMLHGTPERVIAQADLAGY
jgi:hypothetical protein